MVLSGKSRGEPVLKKRATYVRHPAWESFEKRRLIVESGPAMSTLHSTGVCSLSCFMCWHGMVKEIPVTLELRQLEPIFDSIETVLFSGAEPLWFSKNVNVRHAEILTHLIDHHPDVELVTLTNGTTLKRDKLPLALEKFAALCFSIDTLDPETFARIRGRRLFAQAFGAMETLLGMKKELGRGPRDAPVVIVNSIAMNSTLDGLPEMARRLAASGGLILSVSALQDITDTQYEHYGTVEYLMKEQGDKEPRRTLERHQAIYREEALTPRNCPPDRVAVVKGQLLETCSGTGLVLEDKAHLFLPWDVPSPAAVNAVCPMPWVQANVHRNGEVVCCTTNSVVLGNLHEREFGEIWNGPEASALRAAFIKGEMKGCARSGCNAAINHFDVGEKFLREFSRALAGFAFPAGEVRRILLLRTGPMTQTYLTLNGLRERFSGAEVHLVTKSDGIPGEFEWGAGVNVHYYPGAFREAELMPWLSAKNIGVVDIAVCLYGLGERSAYTAIDGLMPATGAKTILGVTATGTISRMG